MCYKISMGTSKMTSGRSKAREGKRARQRMEESTLRIGRGREGWRRMTSRMDVAPRHAKLVVFFRVEGGTDVLSYMANADASRKGASGFDGWSAGRIEARGQSQRRIEFGWSKHVDSETRM
jgi:hypothetical protein